MNRVFSFQPADIIEQLNLRRPIYSKTTNYGHFGKNDKDLTWEATNKVAGAAEGDLQQPRGLSVEDLTPNHQRPTPKSVRFGSWNVGTWELTTYFSTVTVTGSSILTVSGVPAESVA